MNNPLALIMIIVVISCALAAVILIIQNNRKKSTDLELYGAARRLLKEQILQESLKNGSARIGPSKGRTRIIIALSWKDQEKKSYVFDPLETVRFGRSPKENEIVIPDNWVSLQHCRIYQRGRDLILEDLHSTNGVIVVHGLRKTRVRGKMRVFDQDTLLIGSNEILLHVFTVDTSFL